MLWGASLCVEVGGRGNEYTPGICKSWPEVLVGLAMLDTLLLLALVVVWRSRRGVRLVIGCAALLIAASTLAGERAADDIPASIVVHISCWHSSSYLWLAITDWWHATC